MNERKNENKNFPYENEDGGERRFLTPNEHIPNGWIRRQLLIQANGLAGHLQEFWPDIRDSAWTGGNAEGWERVPYWLDGLLPLAWSLDDIRLKTVCETYIQAILDRQEDDGWICPCSREDRASYDLWAYFLILKVFICYIDLTSREELCPRVEKALFCLDRHLDHTPLHGWGQMRWQECLLVILWMYRRTKKSWLPALARKLACSGFDYEFLFMDFPYKERIEQDRWNMFSHGVNLAMMLKTGVLKEVFFDDREAPARYRQMLEQLYRWHGTGIGTFTADECLAGVSPDQGTELCTVVELMYSFEIMQIFDPDPRIGELLEELAFNALPAALSPDMWSHQYDQQVNQPFCGSLEPPPYTTNSAGSNIFGLEPHYGCCTANFGQGWPKFFRCCAAVQGNTLILHTLHPCTVRQPDFEVICETEYPFRDTARLCCRAKGENPYHLRLRIPEHISFALISSPCRNIRCHPGQYVTLELNRSPEEKTEEIAVQFYTEARFTKRPENTVILARGPLFFSLKLNEKWEMLPETPGHEYPHCDYQVSSSFAGAVSCSIKAESIKIEGTPGSPVYQPVSDYPFSPGAVPLSLQVPCLLDGKPVSCTFIPYGCTNVRLTQLGNRHTDIHEK